MKAGSATMIPAKKERCSAINKERPRRGLMKGSCDVGWLAGWLVKGGRLDQVEA